MDIEYKKKIQIAELEIRLEGQIMARHSNELSILRFNSEIIRLSDTNKTLDQEIEKTKKMIEVAKGGGE